MAVITTIRSAFGFLTRLPVGPWPLQNDLNGISAWLPLVGWWGACGWPDLDGNPALPPWSAVIGCACWVAVTGGLHLDGVADCGDGLPIEVSGTQAGNHERLPLGTFGARPCFSTWRSREPPWHSGGPRLLGTSAHGVRSGRIACPQPDIHRHALSGARLEAWGKRSSGNVPRHALAAAAVTLAACALAGWNGLYALLSALAGSMGLLLYARRRLGGVTGMYSAVPWNVRMACPAHLLHFMKTPHKCRVQASTSDAPPYHPGLLRALHQGMRPLRG
ncbi:MAG: adenosylcobinamide-GDP ribazoletransferase [Akkermansia sp.]